MKVIYICGPYRSSTIHGTVDNIRRAESEALYVWAYGGVALCPHLNTRLFDGALGIKDHTWLEGDMELISRCDALWAIEGWNESDGSKMEIEFAMGHNIPVLTDAVQVKAFLGAIK